MNKIDIKERSEITLQRLELALNRLIDGKPEKTSNDGKINLKRINDEAGLSSGGIYYYKEFVEKARVVIAKADVKQVNKSFVKHKSKNFRHQLEEERRLKTKYREQRDLIKNFCDQVVAKSANLEFALFEALERIQQLEEELHAIKVVEMVKGRDR
ncbi:hypothetical protein EA004_13460 [Vibrio anguillarum]|uniref:Uncharacterized protein n=1 Tax=Vibrio anguillarum TaxID=55601 RepID=A0ABR9Z1D3_VIBAN|nr:MULTISPECIES: hypothetical protein [Vibrio]AXN03595.1 hypothetical protein DD610_04715 [Vibrio anguillarum]MBF4246040.1 hypothetical protein [Vibrio anguillarum]MBF4279639.1 hypothetical protein [Vibrio anguillarum]MBF4372266.1 hypothetical protein [Vibrio anguillarum]MBT2914714.1 hypothetical protein [Vibrio anguillarum]